MTKLTPLKLARLRAGISQKELAEIFGIDQANVSRWERDNRVPEKYLLKILELLPELKGSDLS